MMQITQKDPNTFEVFLPADEDTTHIVSVSDDYHKNLTNQKIDKQEFIRLSIVFLLGRESNTEIRKEFNIDDIQDYFPEYEKTIKKLLKTI